MRTTFITLGAVLGLAIMPAAAKAEQARGVEVTQDLCPSSPRVSCTTGEVWARWAAKSINRTVDQAWIKRFENRVEARGYQSYKLQVGDIMVLCKKGAADCSPERVRRISG